MTNIVKHFIRLLIYLIIISFVLFLLLENTTGNPAVQYLQEHGVAQITPERIKMAQDKLGFKSGIASSICPMVRQCLYRRSWYEF